MSIRSRGFKIKPSEKDALEIALGRWLDFERENKRVTRSLEEPDRQTFTQLCKAAKQLQKALEPFIIDPMQPELVRLVCHMQSLELYAHSQGHYQDMVNALYEPLCLLEEAARTESGGPGRDADPFERRWIWTATVAWTERENKNPSSAESGRFFQALQDFQSRHEELPKITTRVLRGALAKHKAKDKK